MTKEEINKMVIDAFVKAFDLPTGDLVPHAKLYEDLDLDSLDAIDLAVRLKNEMGVTLSEEEMRSLIDLSDLINLLEKKMSIPSSDDC